MNFEKSLLVVITLLLVWLAITYGAHLPDTELRTPANGMTAKGYQVIGTRCGFLFLAFLSTLYLLDSIVPASEEDDLR